MADQLTVFAYGSQEFTLTSSDSLTLRTTGVGETKLYRKVGNPNHPNSWQLLSTIQGTGSFTGGPFTSDLTFRIDAGPNIVYYSYGDDLKSAAISDPLVNPWFPNYKVGSIIEYYEDFLDSGTLPADPTSDTIDWNFTTVEAGGGNAGINMQNFQGGVIRIANDLADNDRVIAQKLGENFLFTVGKKTWYRSRFRISDVDDCDAFMGIVIGTATDPAGTAPTDGIWFQLLESEGDGILDFVVSKDSTTTTQAVKQMADNTFIDVAYYYDGVDSIEVFADDAHIASVAATNLPDDEFLSIFIGIQNGDTASDHIDIDYIYAAQER